MGYTHYWRVPRGEFNQERWDEFIKDCKVLYKNMPDSTNSAGGYHADDILRLNGCYIYKRATFNSKTVCFNGSNGCNRVQKSDDNGYKYWEDVDNHGLDHETFVLHRKNKRNDEAENRGVKGTTFGFCKTARKPYDLMVTACLILFKTHFPEVEVDSDGNIEEWQEAFKFIGSVLNDGKAKTLEYLLTNPYEKGGLFEEVYKRTA